MAIDPVPSELLYRACDTSQLDFETTLDLEDHSGLVGQERALEALSFGTAIRRQGYNIFVLGPDGAGKHEAVLRFLAGRSEEHTSELQSRPHLVCRLLLEKKNIRYTE